MNLKPHQVDLIITSGPVRDEFSQKVKELDRRLKMNGMDYKQWDTLTDHQHEIFTDNLFLDGECAASPENYVNGAVSTCGCPDVVEDLHHHSPVLMREIEKQQEMLPDMTVKISENLGFLNELIDSKVESLIAEKKINKGDQYELDVVALMKGTDPTHTLLAGNILSPAGSGGAADADFAIEGEFYNLELKYSVKDYMGSGMLLGPLDNLTATKGLLNEPGTLEIILASVNGEEKKAELQRVVDELASFDYPGINNPVAKSALAKFHKAGALKFPLHTTNAAWNNSGRDGTNSRRLADQYGSNPLKANPSFVLTKYAQKNVFYIQIGGLGLFYLNADPANLSSIGVTQLAMDAMDIELRLQGYGRNREYTNVLRFIRNIEGLTDQERAFLLAQPAPFYRKVAFRASARYDKEAQRNATKSDYDLGSAQGVMEVVEALCAQGRQTGRPLEEGGLSWCAKQKQLPQEDPAEPEGLEVEPEESEGL